MDPLHGLSDAQREAASAIEGPVAILAGAGTGKTRVISHRIAHAVAVGAVAPQRVLVVTFTEKAAAEMVERLRGLGLREIAARTFHSAALAQLRYFWPLRHDGQPLPEVLSDPWRVVAPLARRLPGGYRFTPTKDLIDEIAWAKSRRVDPRGYAEAAGTAARTPPVPVELFARLFGDYERAKRRQGLIDFDDMLTLTVDLLETDDDATTTVRGRYAWFSVDEYQDTNPLQERLLELWLGDRRDVCVVGDEDQTIYTFAGATPEYLTGFAARYPDAHVVALTENHRSTPQVLELANRLIASTGRTKGLVATRAAGPRPTVRPFPDADAELAGIVTEVGRLLDAGVAASEIAVLVRLNAQLAQLEAAFTRAGLPYRVRGQRFFDRRDVRSAIDAVRRVSAEVTGGDLVAAVEDVWSKRLGFEADGRAEGAEARERQAALSTLLSIVRTFTEADKSAGSAQVIDELARRAGSESARSGEGIELSTLHRAKGLEWDAVILPSLEEGLLPVAQAKDDERAIDEERRLLYVGITRAREHLWLSWAEERASAQGKPQRRWRSRFLRDLVPNAGPRAPAAASPGRPPLGAPSTAAERPEGRARSPLAGREADPLVAALRAWRTERSRADGVPAYVVAPDATLAEIAERRPRGVPELRRVPGIGPQKIEKYSSEILALVRERLEAD